jgi:hypothetical protein
MSGLVRLGPSAAMCDITPERNTNGAITMKQRTAIRRVILALSIIPAAWLILFATGAATLVGREQLHVGNAQGVTVTCRYIHATGTYEVIDFTTDPDAVACARFVFVRSPPPATGSRWAAPLPTDRIVQLECRFIRYAAEGDGGLGTRFTEEAPLRLAVNFSAGLLDLVTADDRSALGDPKQDMPAHPAGATVVFEHGAAPIFTGEKPGRLTLMISSYNGRATMFLRPPGGPLLWTREGGCRPNAERSRLLPVRVPARDSKASTPSSPS